MAEVIIDIPKQIDDELQNEPVVSTVLSENETTRIDLQAAVIDISDSRLMQIQISARKKNAKIMRVPEMKD
ncbi:hypothetical protein M0802_012648 [Mischocyttarus mexicanus]|nr:hypothetical protein M0802_012659 [Mischocyttarus mexicanus]KAI4485636.1 hypothetical protein M0802_012648 [Mischocyttarus mexicanus]